MLDMEKDVREVLKRVREDRTNAPLDEFADGYLAALRVIERKLQEVLVKQRMRE